MCCYWNKQTNKQTQKQKKLEKLNCSLLKQTVCAKLFAF